MEVHTHRLEELVGLGSRGQDLDRSWNKGQQHLGAPAAPAAAPGSRFFPSGRHFYSGTDILHKRLQIHCGPDDYKVIFQATLNNGTV